MSKTIKVNGVTVRVLNSLSDGPGESPNSYVIPGGYVSKIGGGWKLQEPGQFARAVTVEAA